MKNSITQQLSKLNVKHINYEYDLVKIIFGDLIIHAHKAICVKC